MQIANDDLAVRAQRVGNTLTPDWIECLRTFVKAHGSDWDQAGKQFTFGTYPTMGQIIDPSHGHKEAFLPLINRGIYDRLRASGEGTGIVMLTPLGKEVVRELGLHKELQPA